jgi:hypothetical protein
MEAPEPLVALDVVKVVGQELWEDSRHWAWSYGNPLIEYPETLYLH